MFCVLVYLRGSVSMFKGNADLLLGIARIRILMCLFNSTVYVHGITKSPSLLKDESRDPSNPVLEDVEPSPESPSPVRSVDELAAASASCVDPETGHSECSATAAASKTEKMMAPEEPPYFQEQW